MQPLLTPEQSEAYNTFQRFAFERVKPFVLDWDRSAQIPASAVESLAQAGYFGATIPSRYGGKGWDTVTFGLLNEALGRWDSTYTGLLTVQSMVSMAVLKWGDDAQRDRWLPALAKGEILAAFALTEPGAGSDLNSCTTEFRDDNSNGGLILNGEKKWITSGQSAGVFLVFGKLGGQSLACLLPRDSKGFNIEPITDLMGFRAAGLARLSFKNTFVPAENVIGRPGFGFSHVAPVGLQYGRISTACSAWGAIRACFEESAAYAAERRIGERRVGDHEMIQTLIAKMGTDLEAAKWLCLSACAAADTALPDLFMKTSMAKYFASRAAVRAASDAVQILGAAGCHEAHPVARFYRNAKVMEIVEGTTQVHEMLLAKSFLVTAGRRSRALGGWAHSSSS